MAALNVLSDPAAIDTSEKLRTVYLYPGQVFTASQPLLVSTRFACGMRRRGWPASITTCCRPIRCADNRIFVTATAPSIA